MGLVREHDSPARNAPRSVTDAPVFRDQPTPLRAGQLRRSHRELGKRSIDAVSLAGIPGTFSYF